MNYYTNGTVSFPLRPAKYKGTRRTTTLTDLVTKGITNGAVLAGAIIATHATGWYATVATFIGI